MTEPEKINARIEEVRGTTDLNYTDFAKKIGIKPNTYMITVSYNRRKPGIDLIQAILRAYKVSARWLILGEGYMWDDYSMKNLQDDDPETLINTVRAMVKQMSKKETG